MTAFPEILADRYKQFKFRHFSAHRDYYKSLAEKGQAPQIMVISCCDSRVDPETIFNALPGELFVVRNVANLIPPYETGGTYHGVSAALEFAVLNLHIRHIIVLGHSGCGGIHACLEHSAAQQSDARFISNWMSMLDAARARVSFVCSGNPSLKPQDELEREGIKTSIENLRSFSYIRDLEKAGSLSLHGAHFDIASGRLTVLDGRNGAFAAL